MAMNEILRKLTDCTACTTALTPSSRSNSRAGSILGSVISFLNTSLIAFRQYFFRSSDQLIGVQAQNFESKTSRNPYHYSNPLFLIRNLNYTQILYIILFLGLALRIYHLLRVPPLWHDEAALVINVMNLSYEELLGPLSHHLPAPPGFLWAERLMVQCFGTQEIVFRILPCFLSCLSLILFAKICFRLLRPRDALWAIAFFSFSDRLLFHAAEAKPYSIDLACACLIFSSLLFDLPRSMRWQLILWTFIAPFLIWFSFPSCFLLSGLIAVFAETLRKEGRWDWWLSALIISATISFVFLVIGPVNCQRDAEMDSCWARHFPDYQHWWRIPDWSFFSTLEIFRYTLEPYGQLLAGFALVGGVRFYRHSRTSLRRFLVLLFLVPWLAVYVASLMKCYPYGGGRTMIFLTPAIILLVTNGIGSLLAWCQQLRYKSTVRLVLLGLLIAPIFNSVCETIWPWWRPDPRSASQWIMENYHAGDTILVNHWEYEYYLRGYPVIGNYHGNAPVSSGKSRIWLAITGDEKDIPLHVNPYSNQRKIVETKRFTGCSVLLLEKKSSENGI